MNKGELAGLYIHVPFCKTKCPYCDFYSVTSLAATEQWVESIGKEVLFYKEKFTVFDSLYLGGGTPSLLGDRELAEVLDCAHRHFTFTRDAEITMELNPDDVTARKLAFLKRSGINRVSLGVQSFDEGELLFLGRRHTARQAVRALELIRSSGFRNIGVDLMYGFDAGSHCSGTIRKRWTQSLEKALAFEPEHLSCYQLTLEKSTPFGRMEAEGKISSLGEEQESDLFLLTSRFLEDSGYIHYEISNFAKSTSLRSRHNSKYWRHAPYLGLGPAAHSFLNGARWWNPRSLEEYCRSLAEGKPPVAGSEVLSREQLAFESLYLGLRTQAGVALDSLPPDSDSERSALAELEKSGLVEIQEGRVVPTRKGFLVADSLPILLDP
jgi:oxygen-independent coproporphyrinogen-3 oxidase